MGSDGNQLAVDPQNQFSAYGGDPSTSFYAIDGRPVQQRRDSTLYVSVILMQNGKPTLPRISGLNIFP